jgi:hypothetical protein
MTNVNFRRTLVGAAVAAALTALTAPAGAAPYRGTFDPTDFSDDYVIDVGSTCLAQSNGWYANAGICAATLLNVNAKVISDDVSPAVTDLDLIFAPPVITSPSTLFGLYVYGHAIDSFDTALIHQQAGSEDLVNNWWIQFTSGHRCYGGPCYGGPILIDAQPEGGFIDPNQRGVYLYLNTTGSPIAMAQYLGPAVDIGAVPEPGTLSLLLGALGGGWLARRRRRKELEANSS